ncbi:hypothetical protein [Methylobacterium aquaticum]|uniref:hypothetical protein n=1 Tax=Methylobacterium aquaticum TaxID=270351 RepID=UPI001FEDCECA|nr:hypothetical protein [Methylobacterium aquaticum]
MTDLLRSTTFRWALGIALWSALLALAMFGFVYWQTAAFLREELAETLRLEVRAAAEDPAGAVARVETWIAMDRHATHYGGCTGRAGRGGPATSSPCRPGLPATATPPGSARRSRRRTGRCPTRSGRPRSRSPTAARS